MRAYVESYGCALNRGEALEIEDFLRARGWDVATTPEGVDLAVLVACVVIESTERRMLRRAKALSSAPRLVVTGCLATARRDAAMAVAPSAAFIPPGDLGRLSDIVEVAGPPRYADPPEEAGFAIVPAATGCLGSCAYCITRLARGSIRSRSLRDVAARVDELTAAGPLEIQLTSQDIAAYGLDIDSDLTGLIDRILEIEHDFRLRIGMMNPKSVLPILDDLAERFKDPRLFKFLHLPIQSASDRMLRRMDRGHDYEGFESIVSRMRSIVPDLTLSTDIIVGYPGEIESDHDANLSMIRTIRPDIVNITRFSPRPGTKAARQDLKIHGRMVKLRSRELTKARFEIAQENNERLIGRTIDALATERGRDSSTVLRSDAYKQVVVGEQVPLRTYRSVLITGATPTHLVGELT